MTRIGFEVVNCFATEDFGGNPICVVRERVAEPLMGRIATQMGCTLTVYPERVRPGRFATRMFTISVEVPFGGSGALAGAWAMGEGRWLLATSGGEVETGCRQGRAWAIQPMPEVRRIDDDKVMAAIGLATCEGLFLGRALGNYHVVAVTADDPADFAPRAELLGEVARRYGGATVGAVRRVGAAEIHGRIFTPAHGRLEDPAVGGGAPTIARIMRDHFGGAGECVIRQGEEMGRPSRMEVELGDAGARVGGGVRKAAEGVLLLD
jgi:trans-2,3-dihydro-3-hydroxyanthranilate isomerase